MNLELRLIVLEEALKIEEQLSVIIRLLLGINNSNCKTLGFKSSALSYMTKVDLLFDLEKIDSAIYNLLKMFCEIRNQFMHNIDAISFEIVLERLSKKKNILELNVSFKKYFENANSIEAKEDLYKLAFLTLANNIMISLKKVQISINEDKIANLEVERKAFERDTLEDMLKIVSESIDEFSIDYDQKMKKIFETKTDYISIIKSGIYSRIEKKLNEL